MDKIIVAAAARYFLARVVSFIKESWEFLFLFFLIFGFFFLFF